jgi:HK97 family phage major capsid protein
MTEHVLPDASAPETKAIDLVRDVDALNRALGEYRDVNDRRLAEIERKGADPLTDEKLARMDDAIDTMMKRLSGVETKLGRPRLAASEAKSAIAPEQKAAFTSYLRSGDAREIARLEAKMAPGITGQDGGYLVPVDVEFGVLSRIAGLSPIRAIASVQSIGTSSLRKAVSPNGATTGWTGDAAPSNVVDPNFLQNLDIPTGELFCQPAATQTMLDDPAVDIESWIGEEIERAFANAEAATFVTGNGTNKPKGFLTYPTVANTSWSWGNLGFVPSGAAGAFAAANPSDALVDLAHALKSGYRQNGTFVMNRKTQAQLRKFKDSTGNYIWQPPTIAGGRASLMNFPVVESEAMPDIAANSHSIAFGDFRRGYLVVDRLGIRSLRDPYSAKPYVLFYTTRRVGGAVQDFDAIKLMRFAV